MNSLLLLLLMFGAATEFRVQRTFNAKPFVYRQVGQIDRLAYRVLELQYPSPIKTTVESNNTVPARYFIPADMDASSEPRPGVVCLHILGGNFELVELTCATLARRGIPALWLKLPFYGERRPPAPEFDLARNPKQFARALQQGIADVRRAIDLLAARPEVDPERVNLMGISLGGIVAASAAGLDDRVHRAALLLAGGDAMTIIGHAPECRDLKEAMAQLSSKEQAAVKRSIKQVDPLTHAPLLRERAMQGRVLMINAARDEVIPRQCTEKLAEALGISDRVIWLEGLGHYTAMAALPQALDTTATFFAQDLPDDAQRSATDSKSDEERSGAVDEDEPVSLSLSARFIAFIQQLGLLLDTNRLPGPGRCHLVDIDLVATLSDGQQVKAEGQVIRGAQHQFRMEVQIDDIGQFVLGQGEHPWMHGKQTVFLGTYAEGAERRDPLSAARPENVIKARVVLGLLMTLPLAPETLEKWVRVTQLSPHELRIAAKDQPDDHIDLVFDGSTPRKLTFSIGDFEGRVLFRAWSFNASSHPSMFEPTAASDTLEVPAQDVYRMMGALVNFAVETAQ